MTTEPLIIPDLVALDADLGAEPTEVINALAGRIAAAGRATDAAGLAGSALEREAKSATGLPGGIAIPHCRSAAVTTASLGFARLSNKVPWGAPDGGADLVFLIAAPDGAGSQHMKLLSALARALVRKDFVASLRAATTEQEIVDLVIDVVTPKPKPKPVEKPAEAATVTAAAAEAPTETVPAAEQKYLVAVTACPTGIAHTYMAADSLALAGEELRIPVKVETQGSSGTTPLSPAEIAGATAVIFATDVPVKGRERFAGKPLVESGVKRAINEPKKMIDEAVAVAADPNGLRVSGTAGASSGAASTAGLSFGMRLRQVLLTGVSYMIPFVAAGGLLIALGFLLAGYSINETAKDIVENNSLTNLPDGGLRFYVGAVLFQIGGLAFSFLVPALSGYIAFGIADRPGIAPGFAAGAVAVAVGAGFLGGLVGGLIAGVIALKISQIQVPRWLKGLMPVVIIPLVTTLVTGGLMFMVLGRPLAAVTNGLQEKLSGMTGSSVIILGVILGLMMCFDLGGPVNKAAYAFATTGLNVNDPATLRIMAAVMAAGMVPPLAMALSTTIRPGLYTEAERENGKAAWLLGASFISEGAIPFAAADPLRVIVSMMAGGAVTGGMVMAFGSELRAPHGGIFVFFAMSGVGGFLAALAVGTVVAALAVTAAKQFSTKQPEPVAA